MQGSSFRLIVRRGPQPNQVYDLNKSVLSVGRDITNDIVINDPEVSRHHCRLTQGGGGYTLEDLGSTNGTFINGQRLTGAQPLSHGDMMGLGETVTLAYESVGAGSAPGHAQTMVSPGGAQSQFAPPGAGGYPAQQQQPYPGGMQGQGAPPAPYGAPPQGPAPYGVQMGQQPAGPMGYDYDYQEEPYDGGGASRWVILGCGCFLVLCIVSSVIGGIIIDATCSWDDIPIISDTFDLGVREDATCR